jgi:oligosaccharide repeat unit polymerase
MLSINILIANASLYTLTLIFFLSKSKTFNVGALLLSLYTFSAWSSVLFYNHKLFRYTYSFSAMKIEPFIYLYIVLMLFLYPFLKFKSNEIHKIETPNKTKLLFLIKVITILQIFSILIQIPSLNNLIKNVDFGDLRNSQYDMEFKFWFSRIALISRTYGLVCGLLPISIVLSLYLYLTNTFRKSNWISLFFYSTILTVAVNQLVVAGRGVLLMFIIFIFSVFLLLNNLILKTKKKIFVKLSIIPLAFFLVFFVVVTQSRFKDMATLSLYRYAGESMINFNGKLYYDLKGTTNGDAYFTLLTRTFDRDNVLYNTVVEKWDYMETRTGVRSQYFYTFIGALMFEFGRIGTFIIALIFSIIGCYVLKRKRNTTLPVILFYSTWCYMFISGVFVFMYQGATGNFTIVFLIFLMFYLKRSSERNIRQIQQLINMRKQS